LRERGRAGFAATRAALTSAIAFLSSSMLRYLMIRPSNVTRSVPLASAASSASSWDWV